MKYLVTAEELLPGLVAATKAPEPRRPLSFGPFAWRGRAEDCLVSLAKRDRVVDGKIIEVADADGVDPSRATVSYAELQTAASTCRKVDMHDAADRLADIYLVSAVNAH